MTATSTLLKNLNMRKEKKHQFIKEFIMFLVTLITKHQENSPLKFHLVRCSSCISPKNMLHDLDISLRLLLISCSVINECHLQSYIELSSNMNHF